MGHKVENTESVVKCFPGHGGDFHVDAKYFLKIKLFFRRTIVYLDE